MLIYVPGQTSINPHDVLPQVGLDVFLRNAPTLAASRLDPPGPDNNPMLGGVVFGFDFGPGDERTARPVYDRDSQEWRPCAPDPLPALEGGRFWLGRTKDRALSPYDLQRPDFHDGNPVLLDDGQRWVIPVPDALPHLIRLDQQTGEDTYEIDPQYSEYAKLSRQFFDELSALRIATLAGETDDIEAPSQIMFDLARKSLGMNYLLTRDVIDWLGLLRKPETLMTLCAGTFEDAAIYMEMEAQKKTPTLAAG